MHITNVSIEIEFKNKFFNPEESFTAVNKALAVDLSNMGCSSVT